MKISDIIYPGEFISSDIDLESNFDRIVCNPKEVESGDILMLPSPSRIPDLTELKERPLVVICGKNILLPYNIPRILVDDPRSIYSNIFFRLESPSLEGVILIGVSGTNGKSTTSYMINHVLTECGYKVGYIGTGMISMGNKNITPENYSMTTPDPPLLYSTINRMCREGCSVIVMEASSHALILEKLSPLRFNYGVFTNLSNEHLDFHGSAEEYFKAKSKLSQICDTIVINIDDEYGRRLLSRAKCRILTAGILWRGDAYATSLVSKDLIGIEYLYMQKSFSFKLSLPLCGDYNAYNSLLAATLCIDMGCKPYQVKNALAKIPPMNGRYEIIKDDITVIIDYAHTSYAFECFLRDLKKHSGGKRITAIFGCGGDRDKGKRPKMAEAAEKYADRVIVTSDNSRTEDIKDIISDVMRGFAKGVYDIREDRGKAIEEAIIQCRDGDIVAVIGKGPEKYNIDIGGYRDFDERDIVRKALRKRRSEKP